MGTQFQVGKTIGNYVVSRILGAGAMGEVYLAMHPQIGRRVAIKVIGPRLAHVPGFAERFMTEAQALCRIKHPNVVEVYDFGQTTEGQIYYLMDYLEGRELADIIAKRGPLPVKEANLYLQQICAGLEAAHRANVIHRDLKPQNIFVLPQSPPRIKILDFGLAKLVDTPPDRGATATGMVMGSPATMSPEQVKGCVEKIGVASDIYSLGAVLYWMLAGRQPFAGDVPAVVLAKHVTDAPPPIQELVPSLPDAAAQLVEQCLAKEPEDRPASATAVAKAFARALRPPRTSAAKRAKRLTEDLKELFKRVTPAPSPAVRSAVVELGQAFREPVWVRNKTTFDDPGEEIIATSGWEGDARIPRRRLLPWMVLVSFCGLIAFAVWQLTLLSLANPDPASGAKTSTVVDVVAKPAIVPTAVKQQANQVQVPPVLSPAKPPTPKTPEVGQPRKTVPPKHEIQRKPRRTPRTDPPAEQSEQAIAVERLSRVPPASVAAMQVEPISVAASLTPPTPSEASTHRRRAQIAKYDELYIRAMEAFTAGHQRKTIRLARSAHKTDPTRPGAPKLLGIVYFERDAYRLSTRYFEKYLRLRPEAPDAVSIRQALRRARPASHRRQIVAAKDATEKQRGRRGTPGQAP